MPAQRKGTQGAVTPQALIAQAASKVPHESAYDALQNKLLSSGITMQMTDDQVGSGKSQPQWVDETITDYLHKYLQLAQSVEARHNKDKPLPMQEHERHRPIEKWLNKNFRNFLKKEENTVYDTSEERLKAVGERVDTQRWYRNKKSFPWLEDEPVEGSTPVMVKTTAGALTEEMREGYPWIKKLPDDTPLKYLTVNPEDSFNLIHLMTMMDYGLSTPDLPDDLKIKVNALPSMSVEDVYERVHKLDLYVKSPDKGDYEKNLELPTVVENTTLNLSSVNPTGRRIFSIGEKKGKPIDQAVGGKWIEIDKGGFTDYSPEDLEKIARYEELHNLAYDRGRPTNLITEAENEELIEIERYMIDNPIVTECGRINEQGGWCIRNEEVEDNYLGKNKLQDVKNKINLLAGEEDFAPNNMTEWKLALDILLDSTGRPHLQVHALKDDAGNVREILEVSPVENRFDMEGYDDQKSRQETYQENDPKYIKKMGRALIEYLDGPTMKKFDNHLDEVFEKFLPQFQIAPLKDITQSNLTSIDRWIDFLPDDAATEVFLEDFSDTSVEENNQTLTRNLNKTYGDESNWPKFVTADQLLQLYTTGLIDDNRYQEGGRVINRRRRGVPKNLFDLHAQYYKEGTDESVDAETEGDFFKNPRTGKWQVGNPNITKPPPRPGTKSSLHDLLQRLNPSVAYNPRPKKPDPAQENDASLPTQFPSFRESSENLKSKDSRVLHPQFQNKIKQIASEHGRDAAYAWFSANFNPARDLITIKSKPPVQWSVTAEPIRGLGVSAEGANKKLLDLAFQYGLHKDKKNKQSASTHIGAGYRPENQASRINIGRQFGNNKNIVQGGYDFANRRAWLDAQRKLDNNTSIGVGFTPGSVSARFNKRF